MSLMTATERSSLTHLDDEGRARAFGRTAQVGAFPIGLDIENFEAAAHGEVALAEYERMVASLNGREMIVGVDRLDYSKGLEERFLAYEQVLEDHEALREQVFLLQIATPSREEVDAYQDFEIVEFAGAKLLAAIKAALPWIERTGIADNEPPEWCALVAAVTAAEGKEG